MAVFGLLVGLFLGGLAAIVLSLVGGVVIGFFGPDLMIYNIGSKRQDEMRMSLPDVLDTLTISVEAGQGFDAALAQVSRNGRGPIAGEVARVLQEMRIGKSRTDALRSLSARTTVPELKGFTSAIVQASDLGVPVGQVLREQSRDMRLKRRQHAEETGAEGADQDPVSDDVLPLPGPVHRGHRSGCAEHAQELLKRAPVPRYY